MFIFDVATYIYVCLGACVCVCVWGGGGGGGVGYPMQAIPSPLKSVL